MAPTGVALQDAKARLFDATDRVVLREGITAATSRSVTDELGVAKGVLHRHFPDFETFLAEWAAAKIARLSALAGELERRAGSATVSAILSDALWQIFDRLGLETIRLVIARDAVRDALRASHGPGLPYLGEATVVLTDYLTAERELGRLSGAADPSALALALIGTGHLLFAGESGATPSPDAVDEMVESIIVGAQPGVAE
jgi:AcrR family transcriptional regulator